MKERLRKKRKKGEAAALQRGPKTETFTDSIGLCKPCMHTASADSFDMEEQQRRRKCNGSAHKRDDPEYDPNNNLAKLLTQAFNLTLCNRDAKVVREKAMQCIEDLVPKMARPHVLRAGAAHGPPLAARQP